MFMMLGRRAASVTTAVEFYFRRFRRLLPLYVLTLAATTLAALHLLEPADLSHVEMDAQWAALFLSNMFGLPEAGYFVSSNEFPLFLHTWSLSTEVQFYCAAPGLVWALSRLDRFLWVCVVMMVAVLSFTLQLLVGQCK